MCKDILKSAFSATIGTFIGCVAGTIWLAHWLAENDTATYTDILSYEQGRARGKKSITND